MAKSLEEAFSDLEQELADVNDSYISTLLKNTNNGVTKMKAAAETQEAKVLNLKRDKPVIPAGPYEGVSSTDAISSVMSSNSQLPSSWLDDERSEAISKVNQFISKKKELLATHEVRSTSIAAAYDKKVDNIQAQKVELMNQIAALNKQIEGYDDYISGLTTEKKAALEIESSKHEIQLNSIEQLINSQKTLIENLAKEIN